MPLFSERHGHKPVRTSIQFESVDRPLRTAIWNVLVELVFSPARFNEEEYGAPLNAAARALLQFSSDMWTEYYALPRDEIPNRWFSIQDIIKDRLFDGNWFEVYDFIEYFLAHFSDRDEVEEVSSRLNVELTRHKAGYRIVSGMVIPITSDDELDAIEDALSLGDPFSGVQIHLRRALELLSERQSPDYRNSIKEAISAVETVCSLIVGRRSTLGDCLKVIGNGLPMHGALREAYGKLYGWTNDAQGIRHGLMEEPNLEFEDAKFMLVSCAAFVNYLIAKADKAGIRLA